MVAGHAGSRPGEQIRQAGTDTARMQAGVLAVARADRAGPAADRVRDVLRRSPVDGVEVHEDEGLVVATWGGLSLGPDGSLLLSRGARRHDRDLSTDEVSRLLGRGAVSALAEVLPPFAAFRRLGRGEAVAVGDGLGFRHLYHAEGVGWAGLSTSARLLAMLGRSALDLDSLALQSLLGWQVGQSTWYEGVTKLGPGEVVRVRHGRLTRDGGRPEAPPPLGLDDAVESAARMLRSHLTAYVQDHPDTTLQLTGGQDSRILLSAVPPDLRRGLSAVTLEVPGSPDAGIARDLAARAGLHHRTARLDSLEALDPAEALALCVESSLRLEGMADPVAQAGLTVAERQFDQGHRLAGLGGEVARGFYYLGRVRSAPVTRARVERLTAWRMFANESADPTVLAGALREEARDRATDRIFDLMTSSGQDWPTATDEFYLYQRMQRWAGVTDTAVCLDRSVVNPMLDDRFIAIARAMAPESKRGSRFLARLQMALDPDLGRLPMDHRPPPAAYAEPGLTNRTRALRTLAVKATAKARQRLGHSTRPPAGGAVLAAKVVDQWRRDPATLAAAAQHEVLDESWLDRMLTGKVDPAPSTVAFVLNVAGLPPR